MPPALRRAIPLVLAVLLMAVATPTHVAAVQAPSSSEAHLLSLINQARANAGRVALPWDNRLADIAQHRSDDMAKNGYFGHLAASQVSGMLNRKGIAWHRWGETLAWNTAPTAIASAETTLRQWRESPGHWKLLMDVDFNYIALGVARASNGRYIWTALLLKGPDRTPPRMGQLGIEPGSLSSGKRKVTLSWSGAEVPLSVLTSGLRDFRVQRRVGSGRWVAVTSWTTRTTATFELVAGKTYRFRVRARDNAGNRSTWSTPIVVRP